MPTARQRGDQSPGGATADTPTAAQFMQLLQQQQQQLQAQNANIERLINALPNATPGLFTKPITALLEFDKHCRFCGLVDPECTTLLYCELRAPHTHAALSRSVTHDQQAMYA